MKKALVLLTGLVCAMSLAVQDCSAGKGWFGRGSDERSEKKCKGRECRKHSEKGKHGKYSKKRHHGEGGERRSRHEGRACKRDCLAENCKGTIVSKCDTCSAEHKWSRKAHGFVMQGKTSESVE